MSSLSLGDLDQEHVMGTTGDGRADTMRAMEATADTGDALGDGWSS
jgi:hypothetical protein